MRRADLVEPDKRFREFAREAARFSRSMFGASQPGVINKTSFAKSNLDIAKTIFGKWCVEIFVLLYNVGPHGFEELRRALGAITARVLSRKLRLMEDERLVERTLVTSHPPRVRYRLTEDGRTLARLGEPVFLFLGFRAERPKPDSLERRERGADWTSKGGASSSRSPTSR
jgi:DNA-binding HxlR family transcriptional regulator